MTTICSGWLSASSRGRSPRHLPFQMASWRSKPRQLEAAYVAVDERHLQGLPPKAIDIRA